MLRRRLLSIKRIDRPPQATKIWGLRCERIKSRKCILRGFQGAEKMGCITASSRGDGFFACEMRMSEGGHSHFHLIVDTSLRFYHFFIRILMALRTALSPMARRRATPPKHAFTSFFLVSHTRHTSYRSLHRFFFRNSRNTTVTSTRTASTTAAAFAIAPILIPR